MKKVEVDILKKNITTLT